ncbi:hypothetical protein BDEG_23654 [Batrachochytrium dendrobatidis JEL423]|uniref:BRO domain-containing protein 1 n=1 Tax=Batrachochytrium dendrobatidis (strain JEL423) TaxID=403673 RepID=A0A177WK63_BATDL|nr:hypothetical protein BDEG_23654 [Batrachochytrium dendrobatidis JEL423]
MTNTVTHSFSELYNIDHPSSLPFNEPPDRNGGGGEASTFFGLPTKRNAHPISIKPTPPKAEAATTSFIGLMMSSRKRAKSPEMDQCPQCPKSSKPTLANDQSLDRNGLPLVDSSLHATPEYAYLDFQRELMPHLLAAVPRIKKSKAAASPGQQALSENLPDDGEICLEDYYPGETIPDLRALLSDPVLGELIPTESQWYLLNQLRIHGGMPERSQSGISKLAHYYSQLLHIEEKFPFENGKISIDFNWYEAFKQDKQVLSSCIQYEKASVLFNLAAIFSQLGSSTRLWTLDGKKLAAGYFQKSAGTLLFIRDSLSQRFKIKLDKLSDLNETTLSAAATFMLAQAAECFYDKTNDEKSSSPVTSLVSVYAADLYDVAHRHAKDGCSLLKHRFPRKWTSTMKCKSNLFGAIAHFHTGPNTSVDRVVAERLARLGVAKELVTDAYRSAIDVGGILQDLTKGHLCTIHNANITVDAANSSHIHETPFDSRLLAPLKRPSQALVNPISLSDCIPNLNQYSDIFHAIIAPNYREDVRLVTHESARVAHAGQNSLHKIVSDIDEKSTKLELQLPHPVELTIKNQGLAMLHTDELQVHAGKLLDRICEFQSEEKLLSSKDMLGHLDRLLNFISISVNEAARHLSGIDISVYPSDSDQLIALVKLRSEVSQQENDFKKSFSKFTQLKALYEVEVSQFCISGWTKEKLSAIIPVLKIPAKNRQEANSVLYKQFEAAKTRRAVDIARIEEVRKICQLKMVELKSLPSDSWVRYSKLKIQDTLAKQREHLVDIGLTIEKLIAEKDMLLQNLAEQNTVLNGLSQHIKDELEQDSLVKSFSDSLDKYSTYRIDTQNEIYMTIALREDSAKTLASAIRFMLNKNHPRTAFEGDGTASRQALPPHPDGVTRDPLVFQKWNEKNPSKDQHSSKHEKHIDTDHPHRPIRIRVYSGAKIAKPCSSETRKRLALADLLDLDHKSVVYEPSYSHALWEELHNRATKQSRQAQIALDALDHLKPSEPVIPSVPEPNPYEAQRTLATLLAAATAPRHPSTMTRDFHHAHHTHTTSRRVSMNSRIPGGFPHEQSINPSHICTPAESNTSSTGLLDAVRGSLSKMFTFKKETQQPQQTCPHHQQTTLTIETDDSIKNPFTQFTSSRKSSYASAIEMQPKTSAVPVKEPRVVHRTTSRRVSSALPHQPSIKIENDSESVIEWTDSEESPVRDDVEIEIDHLPNGQADVTFRVSTEDGNNQEQVRSDYMISRLMKENARLRNQFIGLRKPDVASTSVSQKESAFKNATTDESMANIHKMMNLFKEQESRINTLEKKVIVGKPKASKSERVERTNQASKGSTNTERYHREMLARWIRDQHRLSDACVSTDSIGVLSTSSSDDSPNGQNGKGGEIFGRKGNRNSSRDTWAQRVTFGTQKGRYHQCGKRHSAKINSSSMESSANEIPKCSEMHRQGGSQMIMVVPAIDITVSSKQMRPVSTEESFSEAPLMDYADPKSVNASHKSRNNLFHSGICHTTFVPNLTNKKGPNTMFEREDSGIGGTPIRLSSFDDVEASLPSKTRFDIQPEKSGNRTKPFGRKNVLQEPGYTPKGLANMKLDNDRLVEALTCLDMNR